MLHPKTSNFLILTLSLLVILLSVYTFYNSYDREIYKITQARNDMLQIELNQHFAKLKTAVAKNKDLLTDNERLRTMPVIGADIVADSLHYVVGIATGGNAVGTSLYGGSTSTKTLARFRTYEEVRMYEGVLKKMGVDGVFVEKREGKK